MCSTRIDLGLEIDLGLNSSFATYQIFDFHCFGLIPGSGSSPEEGNSHPLQQSCLENAWTEETRGLQSVGSQRVGLDWVADTFTFIWPLLSSSLKWGALVKWNYGHCFWVVPSVLVCKRKEVRKRKVTGGGGELGPVTFEVLGEGVSTISQTPALGMLSIGQGPCFHPLCCQRALTVQDRILLLLFSCSVVSDSFATPWTAAHQIPLSLGLPRPEYRSGLPFPSPRDLPHPGIKAIPAGGFVTTASPGKP